MIKLLNYQSEDRKITLFFEKQQKISCYLFGKEIYTTTTEGVTKASILKIKTKLRKFGFTASLDEFIGQMFKEYEETY